MTYSSSSKFAVLAVAFVLTTWFSIARAAQLANQQRPHIVSGWVVSVQRGNGQGMFRIRAAATNNNLRGAVNLFGVAVAPPPIQTFTVGPGTQFATTNGVNRVPVSFAALRPGQRIMVQSQGQQAIGVQIFPRNQYAGRAGRAGYVGPWHVSRVSVGNHATPGLATTPTARTSNANATSTNRNVRSLTAARAAHHTTSKKR